MANRKRRSTITRYVYLMSVTLPWWDLRRWGIALSGDRLIKIGVATDTNQREATVDRSTPARVRTRDRFYCANATRHESHLHRTFKEKAYPIIMDGGTEVFRLSRADLNAARRYLRRQQTAKGLITQITATLIFIIIIAAAFAAHHYLQ